MTLEQNFEAICKRIRAAEKSAGLAEGDVKLVAVSKRQPLERVQSYINYCNERGYRARLGENYIQEYLEKKEMLRGDFECHFIGRLQSNKVKAAVESFACIETVDSVKRAEQISKRAAASAVEAKVLLQVNVSADEAKGGFQAEQLLADAPLLFELPAIQFAGLMTITQIYDEKELVRQDYRALRQLSDSLRSEDARLGRELSMGMSADFEIAIAEGASLVRVGSALFGARGS